MTTSADNTLGQVKWFNNKSGFGFITVINGDHVSKDIFVHHSDLIVAEEQYRYLVTGEYVQFKLSEISGENTNGDDGKHKYKATYVKGVHGGTLMCEVRKNLRDEYSDTSDRSLNKPRLNSNDEQVNKDWMVVRRKQSKNTSH